MHIRPMFSGYWVFILANHLSPLTPSSAMIDYEVIICRIFPSHLNFHLPTYLSHRTCVEQRVNGRVPSVFPNDLLILYPAQSAVVV